MHVLVLTFLAVSVLLPAQPPGQRTATALARAEQSANPIVVGPIPTTANPGDPSHDYPYFSTIVDLAAHGYIEEEFLLEGVANRYATQALETGSVTDSGHPYRTRILVRRPVSFRDFNGTVLLEWQNVTALRDWDIAWEAYADHLIRRGYAWIGVSAQQSGIHAPVTGLRAWSPRRYGTLDVTDGGKVQDDGLQYDIFSQATQAVRSPAAVDPMGGLRVQRLIAIGVSQSAARLTLYHNSIHPLANVVDGYVLIGGGGLLRTDLDVKIFKLLSESDVATDLPGFRNQAGLRQPDSDHVRRWEVAAAAHLDYQVIEEQLRPLASRDIGVAPMTDCDRLPLSRIPYRYVGNAVIDHMVRWLNGTGDPSSAPDIEILSFGPPVVVARDSAGNALGGLRLPHLAVPTAINTGINSGPGFCPFYGTYQPFNEATLQTLYPHHGTYVSQVVEATIESLQSGFIVMEDAIASIRDASRSGIGR